MPTMIRSWRDLWGQGDFSFYMVQLANFKEIKTEPGESDWAELREAQSLTLLAEKNTGVACITDIGAAKDIHPKNKQDVAKRLARLALNDLYGFAGKIAKTGPVLKAATIADGKCLVQFDHGGGGLTSYYNEPLRGFAICGSDKKWVWAQCRLVDKDSQGNPLPVKDTVEVWHPDIKEPAAVRYNWADNPQGNLYNNVYLPANPFRTDTWDGVTHGRLAP